MSIIKKIRKRLRPIKKFYNYCIKKNHVHKCMKKLKKLLENKDPNKRIFYLGITENTNLGDLAQYYCITKWLKNYFSDYEICGYDATTIVDENGMFFKYFSKIFRPDIDLIVFQSGYNTQDLGGNHELMHRLIADRYPKARIIMMPQTVFFLDKKNKIKASNSYNKCSKMLFLARDKISYQISLEMFPNLYVKCYPDIVTSLIGKYQFNNTRNKILICRRNDGEKFYNEKSIIKLRNNLSKYLPVDLNDTQSSVSSKRTKENLSFYIKSMIESFSHYKVVITDRFHGTIFALCANTPVIILKTTDHKVTTGAEWFTDIYKNTVYVSSSLEDAEKKALEILEKNIKLNLEPYFEEHYYGNTLRELVKNTILLDD